MKKNMLNKVGLVVAVAVTLVVNMAAVLLPLNNKTTAEISDSFEVYFVPANYVFGVWSIIYLGLIAFAIYQATLKDSDYALVKKMTPAVILASIFNSLWLFMWHYEIFAWTLVLMIMLLISLLAIYYIFKQAKPSEKPRYFELFIKLPFSIYLGWITVATVANVTDIFYLMGWNILSLPGQVWSAIMIAVASLLGVLMILRENDFAYASVIVWAITGIAVKFPNEGVISITVLVSIIVLAVTAVAKQLKKK
jgi:Ca2+/Na+ antiporter